MAGEVEGRAADLRGRAWCVGWMWEGKKGMEGGRQRGEGERETGGGGMW